MKKVLLALLAVLLAAPPVAVLARTHEVPLAYVELDIPGEYDVFTQDTAADDPLFAAYGRNGAATLEYYEDSDIFIEAIAKDGTHGIEFVMREDEQSRQIYNFNQLRENQQKAITTLLPNIVQDGINITHAEMYEHSQVPFIRFSYKGEQEYDMRGEAFLTIYNGQMQMLILYTAEGEVTRQMERALEKMVDSVYFTRTLDNPAGSAIVGSGVKYSGVGIAVAMLVIAGFITLLIIMIRRTAKRNQSAAGPYSAASPAPQGHVAQAHTAQAQQAYMQQNAPAPPYGVYPAQHSPQYPIAAPSVQGYPAPSFTAPSYTYGQPAPYSQGYTPAAPAQYPVAGQQAAPFTASQTVPAQAAAPNSFGVPSAALTQDEFQTPVVPAAPSLEMPPAQEGVPQMPASPAGYNAGQTYSANNNGQ